MNVAKNLDRAAQFFPDHPAVYENGAEITYQTLKLKSCRVASGLVAMGIKPGDMVALCAPNSGDWLAFYFGALRAGAVAVTLSSALAGNELELLSTHAKPRLVFTTDDKSGDFEKFRDKAGIEKVISPGGPISIHKIMGLGTDSFRAVERSHNDTAAILYTGGTTGIPKGVMLTHENINVSSHNVAYSEHSSQDDRVLCCLPLNHVFGQIHIMNATIFSCGCLELLPSFDLDMFLNRTASGRVTKLYAVPTIYIRLMNINGLKDKLGRVRYCFSAAASMSAETVRQWKEQTKLTIYEGYGMTESASAVTYNHYFEHVIGSVGTEVPGVEIHTRDTKGHILPLNSEGEICIRGRNIMKGYLNNPAETERSFWDREWFRSGDVGTIDDRGYLFIVDRLKDMIITGGENVYPREIEEALFARPDVQDCAVVGLPDKEWGERVSAFVKLNPGHHTTAEELRVYLKQRLASFKVPKQCVIVEDLPRNATGKILKREIKRKFSTEEMD
ncbi:MAG: class I adenylate-forming enzyme family protein [Desulfomonilaceae bacterium]